MKTFFGKVADSQSAAMFEKLTLFQVICLHFRSHFLPLINVAYLEDFLENSYT